MSENQRLFVVIILLVTIFVGWDYVSKSYMAPPEGTTETAEPNTDGEAAASDARAANQEQTEAPDPSGEAIPAEEAEDTLAEAVAAPLPVSATRSFSTSAYKAELGNGVPSLRSLSLKTYKGKAPEGEGLDSAPAMQLAALPQGRLEIKVDGQPVRSFDFRGAGDELFQATRARDVNLGLHTALQGEYGYTQKLALANQGAGSRKVEVSVVLAEAIPEESGGGGFLSGGGRSAGLSVLCQDPDDRSPTRKPAAKLEESFTSEEGPVRWVGIDHQYFLFAVKEEADAERCTLAAKDGVVEARLQTAVLSLSPGEAKELNFAFYAGPKIEEHMDVIDPSLGQSIEYGFFAFLARPMIALMRFFHGWVGNWGYAIILLTLLIKGGMFPITYKSMLSMKKMTSLKPEMDGIKERFPNDQQRQQEEMMKLYRDKGVNPLGGCLPMLLQMPIWFALYRALWSAVDLYQQPFLWIADLTSKESGFPVLAVVAGGLMLGQQLVTPMAADNQQAKIMKWVFPVMFFFILLAMPAGLALYMSVNSVLSIGQQFLINRAHDAEEAKGGAVGAPA